MYTSKPQSLCEKVKILSAGILATALFSSGCTFDYSGNSGNTLHRASPKKTSQVSHSGSNYSYNSSSIGNSAHMATTGFEKAFSEAVFENRTINDYSSYARARIDFEALGDKESKNGSDAIAIIMQRNNLRKSYESVESAHSDWKKTYEKK